MEKKNANIAYYIYFLTMTAGKALGLNSGSGLYNKMFVIALLFLAIKLIFTRYTRKEILIIVFAVGIGLLSYVRARESTLLFAILAIIGFKNINFKDLMVKMLWVRSISTIIIMLCAYNGIVPDYTKTMNYGGQDVVMHSMGFSDPNTFFINIFMIMAVYIYVNYDKLNGWHFAFVNAVMAAAYKLSHSRTGMLLLCGLWALIILDKFVFRSVKSKKIIYSLYTLAPIVVAGISVFFAYNYDPSVKIMKQLNSMLTGRLFVMNWYVNTYPVTIFGNTYEFWLNNAGTILEIVDNMYITILMYSGIFVFALYVLCTFAVLVKLIRRKCFIEVIMIATVAVYGFMEEFPLNPIINPFVILIGMLIFSEDKCNAEKESRDNNEYSLSLQS